MESTSLEVALNFIPSKQNNLNKKKKKNKANNYYVIAKLFNCKTLKVEKQIAKLDGNTNFIFKHVNVESHVLCFEILAYRNFLSDKLIGKVYVSVSDLVPSTSSNENIIQESHATSSYEVVSEKRKRMKGVLNMSYNFCMAAEKYMVEDVILARHEDEVKLHMKSFNKAVPCIGCNIPNFLLI